MAKNRPTQATVWEDSGATCMARVVGQDAANITQASLTAIAYKVFDLDGLTPGTATDSGALVVADVVFDTVKTPDDDARWTEDSTGYNFLDTTAGKAANLPTGDHRYRIEYVFDPDSGEDFTVVFSLYARATRSS